jgi:hypothetical protein
VQGEFAVVKIRLIRAGLWIFAVLLVTTALAALPQGAANFVGAWQMTMESGGQGGGGGNRRGNSGAQTLTVSRDGDKFKVTHTTPRGQNSYDATVSGNTISWTEVRQRRNGGTTNIQCTATLDGDTLKGTMSSGQFSREFTATRSH